MSVLVYVESPDGHFKKTGFEVASYASKLAATMNTNAIALVIGKADQAGDLGKYGVSQVIHVNSNDNIGFHSQALSRIIADTAKEVNANVVILTHSSSGKALAGRIAVRMDAGLASGVNALPDVSDGFKVTRSVYSGKAVATVSINTPNKVVSVMGNSISIDASGSAVTPDNKSVSLPATKLQVIEKKVVSGSVPLPEAELVVSAGRGMKGPENWGIIEDLAAALGAATACSRPVSDADWRPHSEHVGQTGLAIRPNLYIAIGISGAIQHLAGVNNSKTIVVINKDPEAPFFKAADYGVVGDLFEVVPRLTEAVKKFKNQ